MGLENLMELKILIEGIDHFTEPFRQVENSIAGAEAKFKSISDSMKLMGKSKSEIDAVNSSLQKMADQKAFSNIANDLERIGMARSDIQGMEQSYMRMAQYQRDMAKAQADYAAGKDLVMSGVGDLAVGGAGAFGIFELVKQAGEFQSNMAVIQDSTGATTKQMQSFGDAVMNASAQVSRFNDMQMGQIAQALSSGGFGNIKDVQSLLLPTAKYAEVQMYEHKSSDPIEATKQAIEMAHTFGNYNPKSFENFLNDFNKYSMMQPGDSSQLAQTLTYLAPTANTMHMKQSDVMALAAIDNVIGLTGSHGGTNSADMILRLIPGLVGGGPKFSVNKKTGKVTEKDPKAWTAMKDLGFIDSKGNSKFFNPDGSIKDLNGMLGTMIADAKGKNPKDLMRDYSAIFGVQGGRAAALLSNPRSLEQLGKMQTQLGKTKSMDQINKDLQATPEGQLNLLKSNSMTLMLRLGQQLAMSLNPAIEQVNKLLSSMLKFSQAHPQVTKLIGDFALFAVGAKMTEGVVKIVVGNFKQLGAAVKMLKLTTQAGELTKFGSVLSKTGSVLKTIGSAGLSAFKWLGGATMSGIKAIGEGLKVFGSGALSVIKTLGQFGMALLKVAAQAAKWAIEVAADWLIAMGPVGWIIAGVTAVIAAGVAAWMTNFFGFRDKMMALWNYIKSNWVSLVLAATGPIGSIISGAIQLWNNNFMGFRDKLTSVWNTVKSGAETAWNGIKSVVSNVINWFKDLPNQMMTIGQNIMQGLANGVKSAIGSVTSTISGVASNVVGTFKNLLGIKSPSKVFAEHGKWIVAGLAQGIDSNLGLATASTVNLARGVNSSFNSNGSLALSSGGYSGGNVYNITVNVSGNITRNERELGDVVSKAILNKVKMQGKI